MLVSFDANLDMQYDVSHHQLGGKGRNMHALQSISGINVPPWFTVSADVLDLVLRKNDIKGKIDLLLQQIKQNKIDNAKVKTLLPKIQRKVNSVEICNDLTKKLRDEYDKLQSFNSKSGRIVARSSGVGEDSATSSMAGIYDSILNINNFDEMLSGIKKVWSSAFSERALLDRCKKNSLSNDYKMAVVIQIMINPVVSGVALSREVSSNYDGVEIAANYGLGESVVSGQVSTDKWLVHSDQGYIIKSILGEKKFEFVADESSGTSLKATTLEQQTNYCLSNEQVLQVAKAVKKIKKNLMVDVDTEFVFDDTGKLFFVQVRPLLNTEIKNKLVVDSHAAAAANILLTGLYSTPGVSHGRLKFIKDWNELTAIESPQELENDIIVAYRVTNVWSHYITQSKGLVTKEGSATSHPILLAREKGIPCLIGIPEKFEAIKQYDGQMVTLDGINKILYLGELTLKKADAKDFENAFAPVQSKPLPSALDKIDELLHSNMLIYTDNQYWLKTPTYQLKLFEQEVNLKRFERISALVPLDKDIKIPAIVSNGFVCNILRDLDSVVAIFTGITLDKCEEMILKQEKCMQDYLNATSNFELTRKAWDQYVDSFIDLRCHIWLGGGLRAYIEKQISMQAQALSLPQCFLEQCYDRMQSNLVEEDALMQFDVYDMATKLSQLSSIPKSLEELKTLNSDLYLSLIRLGENYRFQHNISLHTPLDLNLVFKKVKSVVEEQKRNIFMVSNKKDTKEQYFPDHSDFLKWIELALRSRVNQSNSHHYHIRGQWHICRQLLKLQDVLQIDDIFNFSADDIAQFIRIYENRAGANTDNILARTQAKA